MTGWLVPGLMLVLMPLSCGCAVSRGEDPVRMLDSVVDEMQGDLIRMRQTAAQVRVHARIGEGTVVGNLCSTSYMLRSSHVNASDCVANCS